MARSRIFLTALIFVAFGASEPKAADPKPAHAIAMHGTPKYGPDFSHFDYVNPSAPKGGAIVNEAKGTYDSFNPFILSRACGCAAAVNSRSAA